MSVVSVMPHPYFAHLGTGDFAQNIAMCFAPPQEGISMSFGCQAGTAAVTADTAVTAVTADTLSVSPACPSRSRQSSIITLTYNGCSHPVHEPSKQANSCATAKHIIMSSKQSANKTIDQIAI